MKKSYSEVLKCWNTFLEIKCIFFIICIFGSNQQDASEYIKVLKYIQLITIRGRDLPLRNLYAKGL